MKTWKRLCGTLVVVVALTATLTVTALAAAPAKSAITVQINGNPVVFTDAFPEYSGGRTFVPLRAVMEAMDAQVDYDGQTGTVDITREGIELSMVLGQDRFTVTEDGQTRTVEMDVKPYVKHNRTYVPVRFVAEALKCGVGWDAGEQTVVIVDVDAILGDATFELMDNFSAYVKRQQRAENMTLTGKLDLETEDKSGELSAKPVSAKGSGSVNGVISDKGMQMNWSLKLSGLSELIDGSAGSPMEQAIMQGIIAALSDLKGEMRMDLNSGTLCFSLPAVVTGSETDSWYSLDLKAYQSELLGALDITELTRLKESGVRAVIAEAIRSMTINDSQTGYEMAAFAADIYVNMLSDQAFTQQGNRYVAQIALEDLADMTITLTKQGDDIVAVDAKMSCDVSEDGTRAAMNMTAHVAPDKETVVFNMVMESDELNFKMTLDFSCAPTSKVPAVTPPVGAEVVPLS